MRSIRHVLVVQPYGIGDLLFITPVLRALRLVPTVETVDLLLGSRTESVVCHNPHVDEIYSVDKDLFHRQGNLKTLRDVWQLGKKLRKKKYDLLLDYSLRGEYAFFGGFFLGIPRRAGFDYKRRGFFHNIRLPLPHGFRDRHVVDYFCELAEQARIPVPDRFMEFYLTQTERENAVSLIHARLGKSVDRIMVVSPGGGESWGKDANFKRWPVTHFEKLIPRLIKEFDMEAVVILGSAGERDIGESLAKMIHVPSANFMGEISLMQSAALMEQASLFIGNDGGLVHLAHAFEIPLLAFYGPVDPKVYGPYPPSAEAMALYLESLSCRPCYKNFRYQSSCPNRECLQDFSPEQVIEILTAREFFKNRAKSFK